jgi:hypothetical protein
MNEKFKKEWLSVLETTNIDKRHYDKVLSYIDMYLINENLYGSIDVMILPLSLQILSLIDLDKVEFIAYPMDTENWSVEVSEGRIDSSIVNEISQSIQNKLNDGYRVKIYRVIQNILKYEGKTTVNFRLIFYK